MRFVSFYDVANITVVGYFLQSFIASAFADDDSAATALFLSLSKIEER